MNTFCKAARHVLRTRMTKSAFSEEGAAALERLAETGQLPENIANKLIARYQQSDSDALISKIKHRAIQGLGIGGGLGLAGGAFRGIADQNSIGGTIGQSLGSGLWNAGLGSLIGGGIGAAEAYFYGGKEKEQIGRILQKLQQYQATHPQEEEEEVPQNVPPEAMMANMQAQMVPSATPAGSMPSITYNIHNFGPQAFSPR